MYKCPNCHEKSIGFWKKFFMGPARSTPCSKCGVGVSTPYWYLLILPLFFYFIVYMYRFFSSFRDYNLFLFCFGLSFITLYGMFAPLIVKPETKTTSYHVKNTIIFIVYMSLTITIPLFFLNEHNPGIVDDRIAMDYSFIQQDFSNLLTHLTDEKISKFDAIRELQRTEDFMTMRFDEHFTEMLENPPQTNLLRLYPWLIDEYDAETGLSVEAISFLKALIALDETYGDLGDSSAYEIPINPFKKVSLPPLGVKYFEAVDALLLKYEIE